MPSIEDRLRRYYDREMSDRAARPLGHQREARLAEFVQLCDRTGVRSVVEVGCGAGLAELHRVIRPGGVLEIGVWGADEHREWTDDQGRYFHSRTDGELQTMLSVIGEVAAFDTWSRFDDGGHYQCARVVLD